jgi:hypothetical protein
VEDQLNRERIMRKTSEALNQANASRPAVRSPVEQRARSVTHNHSIGPQDRVVLLAHAGHSAFTPDKIHHLGATEYIHTDSLGRIDAQRE